MKNTQKNKIIASFMGYHYSTQYGEEWWMEREMEEGGIERYNKKRKLYFDTSWDWLMPVVEKIEKMAVDVTISGWTEEYCVKMIWHPKGVEIVFIDDAPNKIRAVYDAVFYFIQKHFDN